MTDDNSPSRRRRTALVALAVVCIGLSLGGLVMAQSGAQSVVYNYSEGDVNETRADYTINNDSIRFENAERGGGHYTHLDLAGDANDTLQFSVELTGQSGTSSGTILTGYSINGTSDYRYAYDLVGLRFNLPDGSSTFKVGTTNYTDTAFFLNQELHEGNVGQRYYYSMWVNTSDVFHAEAYADENRTNLVGSVSLDANVQSESLTEYYPTSARRFETGAGTASIDGSINDSRSFVQVDLGLDVNNYMRPNTSQRYTVEDGGVDVTANSTVTSSDPSVLQVYESNRTLSATGNRSKLPAVVQVTAEYEGQTISKNVTVAKPTVENLDVLPVWWKVTATVGDGMMLWLFGATLLGIVMTRIASPFAGVGGYTIVMIAGWVSGPVSDGVMIATIMVAMFLGLNLAANINTGIKQQ